jgi:hypothetical protein
VGELSELESLPALAAADQADGNAFDRERVFFGSMTIGAKSGFSATRTTCAPRRFKRLTVTSSPP